MADETNPDTKTETNPDTKTETNPDTKTETNPDTKTDEAKTDAPVEAAPASTPEEAAPVSTPGEAAPPAGDVDDSPVLGSAVTHRATGAKGEAASNPLFDKPNGDPNADFAPCVAVAWADGGRSAAVPLSDLDLPAGRAAKRK